MSTPNELLNNLDKVHTTELGVVRIKRNGVSRYFNVSYSAPPNVMVFADTNKFFKIFFSSADNRMSICV